MLRKLLDALVRIGRIELGKYPPTTSPETLYHHHRIARTVGWVWVAAGALMTSSMVEFMLGHDGWLRTISLVVGIASMLVCGATAIPGIAAGLWISSIDQTLVARGLPIPAEEKEAEQRVPRHTMKMVYWFAVTIIVASLAHTGFLGLSGD